MRVELASAASDEFLTILRYYERESPGLGAEFLKDFERGLGLITAFPSVGASHADGPRRLHLRRFPFSLVYQLRPDVAWLIAVKHDRREPGYWNNVPSR